MSVQNNHKWLKTKLLGVCLMFYVVFILANRRERQGWPVILKCPSHGYQTAHEKKNENWRVLCGFKTLSYDKAALFKSARTCCLLCMFSLPYLQKDASWRSWSIH